MIPTVFVKMVQHFQVRTQQRQCPIPQSYIIESQLCDALTRCLAHLVHTKTPSVMEKCVSSIDGLR